MGVLDGKVAIITGASRGLGEAMAFGYASEGATVVLSARTIEDLERVAAACKDAGAPAVSAIPCDVTDESQVNALVDRTIGEHGRIDVFVANAGIANAGVNPEKRFTDLPSYDREVVEGIFNVNVIGTWLCMKAALPKMGDGGSFIAIGSETGRVLRPGSGFYAISKTTIDALATMASREVAERGIRVNVLSPGGMVDTHLFGPAKMPEFLKQMHPPLPLDVIVPAAVFLASDQSKPVTGKFLSGKDFNAGGIDDILSGL